MNTSEITIRADLKIIVIGPLSSGKSSFIMRWTKNAFKENYKATIVAEFGFKIYQYKGSAYRVQLWDIGGQESSVAMAKIFAKDSHGVVIVCDITNPENYKEALKWKNNVDSSTSFVDGGKVPTLLVVNKSDLVSEEEIQKAERNAEQFAKDNGFLISFVTSVKDSINVNESMDHLVQNIIDKLEQSSTEGVYSFNNPQNGRETIRLDKERHSVKSNKEKKKCCNK